MNLIFGLLFLTLFVLLGIYWYKNVRMLFPAYYYHRSRERQPRKLNFWNRFKSNFCSHDKRIIVDFYNKTDWLDNGPDSNYESCRGIAKMGCVECKHIWLKSSNFCLREKNDKDNISVN